MCLLRSATLCLTSLRSSPYARGRITYRFLVVLVFISDPTLDGHIPNEAGKSLSLFSAALTLILWSISNSFPVILNGSILWTSSAILLVINARKETTRNPPRRQDIEINHTQTTTWPPDIPKQIRTNETTETDTSSKGTGVEQNSTRR